VPPPTPDEREEDARALERLNMLTRRAFAPEPSPPSEPHRARPVRPHGATDFDDAKGIKR